MVKPHTICRESKSDGGVRSSSITKGRNTRVKSLKIPTTYLSLEESGS